MMPLSDIGGLGMPQGGPPRRARSKGRRVVSGVSNAMFNTLMILLIVGIIAISVAVGAQRLTGLRVEATPVATTSLRVPTPTLGAGYAGFDAGSYTVAYPAAWSRKSHDELVISGTSLTSLTTTLHMNQITDQQGRGFLIGTVAAIPADQLHVLVDGLAQYSYKTETLQTVATNLTPTYDGVQWVENDYSLTQVVGSAAVQLEMRVLAANHNATTYVFVIVAAADGFDTTDTTIFEPILASFRFQ